MKIMTHTVREHRLKRRTLPDLTRVIVARLEERADELRQRGVTSMVLFGSRVRGDARRDSDLDVLIDYDRTRPFTLYDLVEISGYLNDIVGLETHVVTRDGFAQDRLRRLLKHAVEVF